MFREKRVSVWEDKNVPEMGGGDGYTILRMYLVPLNYTLKIVKIVNFMLYIYILPHFFLKRTKYFPLLGLSEIIRTINALEQMISQDMSKSASWRHSLHPHGVRHQPGEKRRVNKKISSC